MEAGEDAVRGAEEDTKRRRERPRKGREMTERLAEWRIEGATGYGKRWGSPGTGRGACAWRTIGRGVI